MLMTTVNDGNGTVIIHVMVTALVKVTMILETEVGRVTVATLAMKMATLIAMTMAIIIIMSS